VRDPDNVFPPGPTSVADTDVEFLPSSSHAERRLRAKHGRCKRVSRSDHDQVRRRLHTGLNPTAARKAEGGAGRR